jgi:hypothetical protein
VGDSGSELRLRSDIAHNRPAGSRFFDDSNPSPLRRDYPPLSFFNIETTVMVSINNQSALKAEGVLPAQTLVRTKKLKIGSACLLPKNGARTGGIPRWIYYT